jgi:hypothetical protein
MKYEVPRKRRLRWRERVRRPRYIAAGVVLVALVGWHLVPAWRKHVLESALDDLKVYRHAHGRFPRSQVELEEALDERALARWGCFVAYHVGPDWDSYTVTYRDYDGGKGCTLHFNHDCFCDFPDTSRYEASLASDGTPVDWGSWCD